MIALFTDFGVAGPYVGQVKAVLARLAADVPVIDLLHEAAPHQPELAAYALAALVTALPRGTTVLAVVDPGVGGPRAALALRAAGRWYVGPDNGLLAIVARRSGGARWYAIPMPPGPVAPSFHGRDVFAPAAARLARGEGPPGPESAPRVGDDWPDDLARVVHVDRFGNLISGVRAATLGARARVVVGGQPLARARTFCDLAPGTPFWYENSSGLVEIAVNQGSAAAVLGIGLGAEIAIESD